jgi:hypothetical protein
MSSPHESPYTQTHIDKAMKNWFLCRYTVNEKLVVDMSIESEDPTNLANPIVGICSPPVRPSPWLQRAAILGVVYDAAVAG